MTASTLSLLFGIRARVPRRAYVTWGLLLAVLKFLLDTAIVRGFTGKTWSPLGYVVPSIILRDGNLGGSAPEIMHVMLATLALPFLWVGLSTSVRRAADAGMSPWFGVGFLVPLVNYVTIAVLAFKPSQTGARWEPVPLGPYRAPDSPTSGPTSEVELPSGVRAALLGLAANISIGLAMVGLSVYGLKVYGTALFFVTPFTMGAVSSLVYNASAQRTLTNTLGLALVGTVLTGSIILLFAIEGVLCLAMAFPIAAVLSAAGAIIAWVIATSSNRARNHRIPGALLVLLPGLTFGESKLAEPTLRHVTTTIEVDAPPERVWPNVVGFSDLPSPPEWVYRLGVAYPMRARIDGSGVGAVRHCEFSTGAFVEPITVWDAPHRLAFDVVSQPPSMTEWSPYRKVNAPHLEGYMVSKGGEFRLVPLAGGRTRVEGTTHYTLAIYPEGYWVLIGEALLHGIHARVLDHIKRLSEESSVVR